MTTLVLDNTPEAILQEHSDEKEFSENHQGDYEIFLVGDEIHKITDIDFSDKTKFDLVSNEFIVNYTLDKH